MSLLQGFLSLASGRRDGSIGEILGWLCLGVTKGGLWGTGLQSGLPLYPGLDILLIISPISTGLLTDPYFVPIPGVCYATEPLGLWQITMVSGNVTR